MSIFGTPDREEKSVSLMADFILKALTDILKEHKNTEERALQAPAVWVAEAPKHPQGFHFPSLKLMQDKVPERKGKKKERKKETSSYLKAPTQIHTMYYRRKYKEKAILGPEGDLQKGSLVQSHAHHLGSR